MAPRWTLYQAAVGRTTSKCSTTSTQIATSFLPAGPVALTPNHAVISVLTTVMSNISIAPALKNCIVDCSFGQDCSTLTAHCQIHSPAPAVKSSLIVENNEEPTTTTIEAPSVVVRAPSTVVDAPDIIRAPHSTLIKAVSIITIEAPSSSTSNSDKTTKSTISTSQATAPVLIAPETKQSISGIPKRASWDPWSDDDPWLDGGSTSNQQTKQASRAGTSKIENANNAAKGMSRRKPDTSDVVARRMIGAALGIKVPKKDDEKTAVVSKAMRLNNKERLEFYDAWKAGNGG